MEHRKPAVSPEVAMASEVFDHFCSATTLKTILGHHRHLCDLLHLKPNVFPLFYPKLKAKLRSWKAQALWNKFDKRASHKCYNRGKACSNTRVLIIGAGPCGMRSAIEAQLLGCKVVVVEKRDRITRNNVLHLWPFVIQDLRALGAKKFFGKFCAGAIDHISIRQLQCILLKVALILGVEFHEGVGFEALVPPPENQSGERIGWRCVTSPPDHPVSQYEFDVLIGADGKRNTLEGFRRKEFRGKLAIAITANFINRRTEAEARVEEISGVAFIFNQKFFKDLYAATGIDLENIVYYKDETHYFVMTAKKHSLLNKNVIIKDLPDTAKLLDRENVNKEALEEYAREAADFSTNYKLPHTEFAVNHYGQPDVAMFDFTSMYAAENASRVVERNNHKLLTLLVGDSLLEPFWPTGSGCARGFLSVLDACWAVRAWGMGANPLEVLAERESVYRLLGQTTPENLNRDLNAYTLEPHTRYPNLNARCVAPIQVRGLFDSDNPEGLETLLAMPSASALDPPKKRRRKDSQVHSDTLLMWLKKQVALYDNVRVDDMTTSFKNGLVLCAIIHRYRPDLIDFHALQPENIEANNQLAFDILERELGVSPVMTAQEMEQCEVPDKLAMLSYLSQIYDTFRGEIPHIKHPRLDEAELAKEKKAEQIIATRMRELDKLTTGQKVNLLGRLTSLHSGRSSVGRKREAESDRHETPGGSTHSERVARRSVESARKSRKRRSNLPERMGHTLEERMVRLERLEEIKRNREERERRGRYLRELTTQQFHKSMQMLQANALLRPDGSEEPFEDYSIFLYRMTAPDFQDRVKHLEQKLLYSSRDSKTLEEMKRGSMDPDFSGRVKNIEEKLKGIPVTEKKPKDLLRAIGKIEKTDWNVQEIEKKIEENKSTSRLSKQRAEKVPKWSREKFQDKMLAVERKLKVKSAEEDPDNKYQDIDINLKKIEKKLKEGSSLESGKVSAMAAQLASMNQESDKPSVQRSNSRAALVLPAQGGSEVCHFCNKRVYLMERLSAEGRFFHRGCFRCEYCKTTLRLGNYAFDRDGKYGSRFFCTHHFGFHGTQKMKTPHKLADMAPKGKENIPRRSAGRAEKPKVDNTVDGIETRTPKTPVQATAAQELDKDRGHTPERITFDPVGSSDPDDNPSEMDEDEWTDRNFGASAAECGSSDDLSDLSDESDGEEAEGFAEAIDAPLTADETLRLAERWSRRFSSVGAHQNGSKPCDENDQKRAGDDEDDLESGSYDYDDSEDDFSYHEYDSEDDESDTATEGEEDIRARELRKQEVRLVLPENPPGRRGSDTGSDTEVASDDYSSSESKSEVENSATEIETDSEFEHDGTTPTRHEIPDIIIDDSRLHSKESKEPKKVQVRTGNVQNGNITTKVEPSGIKLQFSPLESKPESNNNPQITRPSPLVNPRRGDYLLNRTHSTEGIASKLSLELKKRYLLGGDSGTAVRKSGSATTLDTRFKSFVDQISEHQKLLNPAPEPSPSMQAFLQGTSKLHTSPLASTESKLPSITTPAPPTGKKELPVLSDSFQHVCGQKETSQPSEKDAGVSLKEKGIQLPATEGFQHVCGKSDAPPVDDKDENLDSLQPDSLTSVEQKESNENQADCRPRSPVHETSIIVPSISWDNVKEKEDDMDSDSLSSDISIGVEEIDEEEEGVEEERPKAPSPTLPPRVEIHNSSGELLTGERQAAVPKSLQLKRVDSPTTVRKNQSKNAENQSGRSSPSTPTSLCGEAGQAALTETELSDWAGDAGVSEDLEDVEFVINPEYVTLRRHQKPKDRKGGRGAIRSLPVRIATGEDFGDFEDQGHVCGKTDDAPSEKVEPLSVLQSLEANIEFMDTAEDGVSVADEVLPDKVPIANRGYVHFVDLEEKDVVSAANHALIQMHSGEGYLPLKNNEDEEEDATTPIADVNLAMAAQVMSSTENSNSNSSSSSSSATPSNVQSQQGTSSTAELITDEAHHDEESHPTSSHHEALTTTEDTTTTSDATTVVDAHAGPSEEESAAYQECIKRLQGRVSPFVNVRDSIDVRKSRKSSKSSLEAEPIQKKSPEAQPETPTTPVNTTANSSKSPTTSRKLEQISQERSKQKSLIHDLVMDKVLSQKKLHERKPRKSIRSTPSPLAGSFSHGCIPLLQKENPETKPEPVAPSAETPTNDKSLSAYETPNTSSKEEFMTALKSFKRRGTSETRPRPISVHGLRAIPSTVDRNAPLPDTPLQHPDGFSMPDIRKALFRDDSCPSLSTPRTKNDDRERARQDARFRAQLKTDAELGLSPEDYIRALKEKASRKPDQETPDVFRNRPVDGPSSSSPLTGDNSHEVSVPGKRKPKDSERRRSIIQAVSDFFLKKSNPSPSRSSPSPTFFREPSTEREHLRFPRFRLKSKDKEKVNDQHGANEISFLYKQVKVPVEPATSVCKTSTPFPKLQPPTGDYISNGPYLLRASEDSFSEADDAEDSTATGASTHSAAVDSSAQTKKHSRQSRRALRQAQLKRLRMAQEIQRQLEEVEVKQRELERLGVSVEKALRGEGTADGGQEEVELLQEWFVLMRERSQLSRYEKELMVRAKELEFEDTHARLQLELRDRMAKDDANKTEEEMAKEGQILKEMLEIAAQRDSLIALLEADRQRYQEEDKDLEAQMLAKGLRLTPLRKESHV